MRISSLAAVVLIAASLPLAANARTSASKKSGSKGGAATPAPTMKPGAAGISDASVSATATEFVEALNSLDDERILAALSPSDRLALRGRENMIGIVMGRKILNPQVKSWEKVEKDGKLLGAKATVVVDEVDQLEGTKASKEHVWFFALDPANTLKVSLSSVWIDAGKAGTVE